MADTSKPISFCEHLQLSSLGVQPASISFQVRVPPPSDLHTQSLLTGLVRRDFLGKLKSSILFGRFSYHPRIDSDFRIGPLHMCTRICQRTKSSGYYRPCGCQQCPKTPYQCRFGHNASFQENPRIEG